MSNKNLQKREPNKKRLKNWPIKFKKFDIVYDIFNLFKKNNYEGIIKIRKEELNYIKKLKPNSKYVHFNLFPSYHEKNKQFALVEIVKEGYFKNENNFKLPTLNLENIYRAVSLEIVEKINLKEIKKKYLKYSPFENLKDLENFILKKYKNIINKNDEIFISITVLKIIKKESLEKYSYYDFLNQDKKLSQREGFGDGIVEIANKNKNILALTADLKGSLKLNKFEKKFPNRFFEFGISEQNMASAAAGMALIGKIPYITSFAVFNPGRNWDQIRASISYSNLNVKIIGSHAGLTTGEDGATHQALEDIAITRVIPNMKVVVPADYNQCKYLTKEISKIKSPVYMRFSREKSLEIFPNNYKNKFGKIDVLDEGDDITLISYGIMLQFALEAREKLERENIKATVINVNTIKPLDVKNILKYIKKSKAFLVIEEHQKAGGLFSTILEEIIPIYNNFICDVIAVNDKFGQSGKGYELLEKYGLNTKNIIKKSKELIKKKSKNEK